VRPIYIAVLLVTAGCASPQAADKVDVVWNRVDDAQATCQSVAGRKEIFAIRGCSKWSDAGSSGRRTCSIYAPAPKNERDTQAFATLGHELMHCFDGNWHDKWGRMDDDQAAAGHARRSPPATAAD
jgi:hypothetical protein